MSGIKYELHENHLPVVGKQHTARVRPTGLATLDDIVDLIVGRGSTVARSDILSVLDDFAATIENLLVLGMSVVTPHGLVPTLALGHLYRHERRV